MSVNIKVMKKTWRPVNTQVNENTALFPVMTGDIVLAVACNVKQATGRNTPKANVGDTGSVNRYMTDAQSDMANTGIKSGCGVNMNIGVGHYIYPSNSTINVVYTGAAADGTIGTGIITFAVWILKTEPF